MRTWCHSRRLADICSQLLALDSDIYAGPEKRTVCSVPEIVCRKNQHANKLIPSHLTEGSVLHSCTALLLHVMSTGGEWQVSFTLPEGAKCEQGERTPGKPFQRSPRRVSPNKSHSRSVRHDLTEKKR